MKKIITTILVAISFLFFGTHVHVQANELQPIKIEPILPSNQDHGITDYISITTDGDELKQELSFIVTNNTTEEITLSIDVTNALSSPNGTIQYIVDQSQGNASLIDPLYGLPNYVEHDQSVTLKGEEEKIVRVQVDIPKVDGTILGSVAFKLTQEGKVQEKDDVQYRVNNEINGIVGIQINFGTDKKPVFEIGEPYVDPMPAYYVVRLPITYDIPLIQKEVSFNYEVLAEDERILFQSDKDMRLDFAPKTRVGISIPWDSESINDGETYTLKGALTYDGNTIEFTRTFKYEKEGSGMDVSFPDRGRPTSNEDHFGWWWLLLILLFILMIIEVTYIGRKKKNVETNSEVQANQGLEEEEDIDESRESSR